MLSCACVCPFQIKDYEKLDSEEERLSRSRQIYDVYIMKELLSCSHVSTLPSHQSTVGRAHADTQGTHLIGVG